MKRYPILISLAMLIALTSCESYQAAPVTPENKIIPIEPVEKQEESTFSKIMRLEKEYENAPLLDSFLLLGIKSGISRREFDRIITAKGISKEPIKVNGRSYNRYEFKAFDNIPNIFGRATESFHHMCGLAGFEVEFLIKGDALMNKESQTLIDWGNGAVKEGNKKLLSDLLSKYQASIINNYKLKYGEPIISSTDRIVWFIGRKKIDLMLISFEIIMESYEEDKVICPIVAFYEDLELMRLYDEAYKRDAIDKLNI